MKLLIVALLGILFLGACQREENEPEDEGLLEILNLNNACDGIDNESQCCLDECSAFCRKNGRSATKTFMNGMHCTCWCG